MSLYSLWIFSKIEHIENNECLREMLLVSLNVAVPGCRLSLLLVLNAS